MTKSFEEIVLNLLGKIDGRLNSLERDVSDIKADVKILKDDVKTLKLLEGDTHETVEKLLEINSTQVDIWKKALTVEEAKEMESIHKTTRHAVADHERRIKRLETHVKAS